MDHFLELKANQAKLERLLEQHSGAGGKEAFSPYFAGAASPAETQSAGNLLVLPANCSAWKNLVVFEEKDAEAATQLVSENTALEAQCDELDRKSVV